MSKKIYVGNLPWSFTQEQLAEMLSDMGYDYASAKVVVDRDTGKSRGFAFVEFRTPEAAREAIENLNGHVIGGRPLWVSEAIERRRGGWSDWYAWGFRFGSWSW